MKHILILVQLPRYLIIQFTFSNTLRYVYFIINICLFKIKQDNLLITLTNYTKIVNYSNSV